MASAVEAPLPYSSGHAFVSSIGRGGETTFSTRRWNAAVASAARFSWPSRHSTRANSRILTTAYCRVHTPCKTVASRVVEISLSRTDVFSYIYLKIRPRLYLFLLCCHQTSLQNTLPQALSIAVIRRASASADMVMTCRKNALHVSVPDVQDHKFQSASCHPGPDPVERVLVARRANDS